MSNKKYKLTTALVASVCWLGLQGSAALAADQKTDDSQLLKKLTERTESLALQVKNLKGQLAALKKQPVQKKIEEQPLLRRFKVINDNKHPVYMIGTPAISSPYIGIKSEYNASDLVVNLPFVNEDRYLLQQRKQLWDYLKQHNENPVFHTPIVNFSGRIEAQVVSGNSFSRDSENRSMTDVDLSGTELDTEILVNPWVTGLIAIVYDNNPAGTSPRRIDNSNVYLDRASLTVGNLALFPMYATVGQIYVPFGQYSSGMISDPFTKTLGRAKARAISVGFSKELNSQNNLNLSIFGFKGSSQSSLKDNGLRNYGADVDYTFTQPKWSLRLGTSYIRNIADAVGMQHNGNSGNNSFNGFATNNETEIIKPVAGLDARGTLMLGPVSLTTEYVTAARLFEKPTLSFNDKGAKPAAFHTEVAYNFNAWDKPGAVMIGYDQSKDALALLLPKKRYIATVSTSIWKDTIESIEFRHDIDYKKTDIAAGGGAQFANIRGTGDSANTVTVQMGIYF